MTTRDWRLAPPACVTVEAFDMGRDTCGNGTAHYALSWDNGKAGAARQSGHYSTRGARRVQVGYRDHVSGGAIGLCLDLFPGAVFRVEPGSVRDFGHRRTCRLVRDPGAESVPVLFRAERAGDFAGEVTAVFPTLPGTDYWTVTVYAHVGQHGTGNRDWYAGTRAATEAEAAPLRAELERIGYRLKPVRRWTRHHDDKRRAVYAASREDS